MQEELKKLIDTAAGRIPADTVIKNCQIVNVFSGKIQTGDIAFSGDKIAGIGEYQGVKEIDAQGRYAVPGFFPLLCRSVFLILLSSYQCPPWIYFSFTSKTGSNVVSAR